MEVLGKGTFGQVVSVVERDSGEEFAIKIIKSAKNYSQYILNYEVKILGILNKFERKLKQGKAQVEGIEDQKFSRIVKLRDQFEYKGHLVLVFEKLEMSLYDMLKIAEFNGLTLNVIRKFGKYILEGLLILNSKKIVHCDLKPENIMLVK
jgi:serine/threonine protein kinase